MTLAGRNKMSYKSVSCKKEDHVAILNFGESSLKQTRISLVSAELSDICTEINSDRETRVVVIFGLETLKFPIERSDWQGYLFSDEAQAPRFFSLADPIADLECPVIVGIGGDLTGLALEWGLAGDIRICSNSARFCLPHVAQGFIPWDGGGQRLCRIAGRAKALELLLTGASIDAAEACRIGIVGRVVSPEEVEAVVMASAHKMAAQGPIALKYAKEAIVKGLDMSLDQGLRLEADLYALLQTTYDRTEGIESFRQKKTPEFKGE